MSSTFSRERAGVAGVGQVTDLYAVFPLLARPWNASGRM